MSRTQSIRELQSSGQIRYWIKDIKIQYVTKFGIGNNCDEDLGLLRIYLVSPQESGFPGRYFVY
jgi:hypothetical protein